MASQIKLRRGTAAEWTLANPTLAEGEAGFETDTYKLKIGDGSTAWNSLSYFSPTPDLSAYLTQSSASTTYAKIVNPTFTDQVEIYGDLQVDGQINLLTPGSAAYINGYSDIMLGGNILEIKSDNQNRITSQGSDISKTSGVVTTAGNEWQGSSVELFALGDNGQIGLAAVGDIIIDAGNGAFLNSSGSANQIATIGDLNGDLILNSSWSNVQSVVFSNFLPAADSGYKQFEFYISAWKFGGNSVSNRVMLKFLDASDASLSNNYKSYTQAVYSNNQINDVSWYGDITKLAFFPVGNNQNAKTSVKGTFFELNNSGNITTYTLDGVNMSSSNLLSGTDFWRISSHGGLFDTAVPAGIKFETLDGSNSTFNFTGSIQIYGIK